jgi:hypothetical protein
LTDRGTDGQTHANSGFSAYWENALKIITANKPVDTYNAYAANFLDTISAVFWLASKLTTINYLNNI